MKEVPKGPKMRCDLCAAMILRTQTVCPHCNSKQPQRLSMAGLPSRAPTPAKLTDAVEQPELALTKLPQGMNTVQALEAAIRTMAMQFEYLVAQLKIISDVVELMKGDADAGGAPGTEKVEGSSTSVAQSEGGGPSEPELARDPGNKDGEGGNGPSRAA